MIILPPKKFNNEKMNHEFKYEIDSNNDWFIKIKIPYKGAIVPEYPKVMLLLVDAAKLMVGETPILGYNYHSFLLEENGLTIIIEDSTRHRLQNANKIAKHLGKLYKLIMSHYGCGNGLSRK